VTSPHPRLRAGRPRRSGGGSRAAVPAAIGHRGAWALACAGAAGYGVTVVIGRKLAHDGLEPATALSIRFAVAACVLGALLSARRVAPPAPGVTPRLLALGAIGYAGQSTLFYLSLQRTTAATSILLFYAYPALVSLIGWLVLRERRPCGRTWIALGLSAGGSATVATAGGGAVAADPLGIAFALGSALGFALYLLAGQRIGAGTDAMHAAARVAAGAAVASLAQGVATGGLDVPAGHVMLLLAYGAFTAAAFTLMFAALARLGARRTAVVMTLEAVFAVGLAMALLGEPLGVGQAAGGAAVLAATIVIARTR
jgi:drug/metabolite transporter (DMT)-like permease